MVTALILPPRPASFFRVAGLPLIVRTALAARRAGCSRVVAIAGSDALQLARVFMRHAATQTVIVTGDYAAALVGEQIVVLPSDYALTGHAIEAIRAAAANGRPQELHCDPSDLEDPGIIVGPSGLLAPQLSAMASGGRLRSVTAQPSPISCVRIVDGEDVARAERLLLAEIRASSADTDGPLARFDRALSTRLSRFLVRTPLRPNHITLLGTALGLTAAWCFAQGAFGNGVLGALLFWVAVIIDGCDGEVARLRLAETRFGHLLDVGTDNLVHVAIFLGIGLGAYRSSTAPIALVWLLVAGFLCAAAATYFCLLRHPPVKHLAATSPRGRIQRALLRGFEALMNRDFAYLLLVLAAVNRLDWFLWGAAFGTFIYAAGLVLVYRWRDAV